MYSLHSAYPTLFQENLVIFKIMTLPSGTLIQTLNLVDFSDFFAMTR